MNYLIHTLIIMIGLTLFYMFVWYPAIDEVKPLGVPEISKVSAVKTPVEVQETERVPDIEEILGDIPMLEND